MTVCIVIQFFTLFIQTMYITHGFDKPEKEYRPNIIANHQHPFEPITYKHVSQSHRNPMGLLVQRLVIGPCKYLPFLLICYWSENSNNNLYLFIAEVYTRLQKAVVGPWPPEKTDISLEHCFIISKHLENKQYHFIGFNSPEFFYWFLYMYSHYIS